MVIIKLAIIALVITVGVFYIDIDNWTPFMPNGFTGVMGGVAAVFFAYIGFDAVSTLAEESKNPQRDLPRGMIYSLIICTVVFVILALVLTGMVSYSELNVSDPLAEVFSKKRREVDVVCCFYCSGCGHDQCNFSFPNGTTPYLDEHEQRWFITKKNSLAFILNIKHPGLQL